MEHWRMGALIGVLLGANVLATAAEAPARADPALEERVAARLVRLPVLFEEQVPGACASLSGSHVELREDGQPVDSVYVESARLETLHAVLIDTGSSMLDSLEIFRQTTATHIAALPEDEPALLATFDDSLVLHAPLSTDRVRFKLSLDWIETGGGKHLWDATRQLINYLRPLSGRKVLLLLTDGCDTQRVAAPSAETVIDEAGKGESVVVFAIGVDMPAQCPGTDVDPAVALRRLARATGGEFHALNKIGTLEATVARIRDRLERERVIQYEPLPFGEGPRDRAAKHDHRYRKLDLKVRDLPGCRGRLAGAPTRYESASLGFFNTRGGPAPESTPAFRDVGGSRLQAVLVDIVQDGGAPSDMMGLRPAGPGKPRRTAERTVAAVIPSLGHVVRADAGPETVVFNALRAVAGPPLGDRGPLSVGEQLTWTDVPFLVNGRTLLDTRHALARALADNPEYGRWAFRRVGQARLAEMDALLDQAATPELRVALARARSSLTTQSWSPDPGELESYLGAWLGDVRAPEMFNAAETWLARRLLHTGGHGQAERLGAGAVEVERLWTLVQQWFPPAEDVGVIGMLLPGYDAERDLVGYYRVTLKQSTAFAIYATFSALDPTKFLESEPGDADRSLYHWLQRWNYSRAAPLGARMIRWMLEQEHVRPLIDPLTVTSIRYTTESNRDLSELLTRIGMTPSPEPRRSYLARQVTLTLADRENPEERFEVHAYFPTLAGDDNAYADAPGCVVLPRSLPREGRGFELYGALFHAKKHSAFPCVFQAGVDGPPGSRRSGG